MPFNTLTDLGLAIIQGFTEIFPVSSSGHLTVYGRIFGTEITFGKILFLHLGTILAILSYYRHDLIDLLNLKLGLRLPLVMLASLAATGLVGGLLEEKFADSIVAEPEMVNLLWVVNGIILVAFAFNKSIGSATLQDLRLREFLIIGAVQGIAALPGISRLGLTLAACLGQRLAWREAVKLSFLLSIPTILAANLFKASKLVVAAFPGPLVASTTYATPFPSVTLFNNLSTILQDSVLLVVVFVCATLGLHLLYRYVFLGRRLLFHFGVYCILAGLFFSLYLRLF